MKRICGLMLAMVLISCGGSQKAAESAVANAAKTKVVKAHTAAAIDFKNMQSRLGVKYQDENRSQSINMDLRMEKGKQIWMSARIVGFTVAKARITPDKVQFYDNINKRSFDGDFKLISKFLGEELNYYQLENLLLGQTIEPLNGLDYAVVDNRYQFTRVDVITRLFQLRPSDFKVAQQSISKPNENTDLTVKYLDYQTVSGKIVPNDILINANAQGKLVQVELDLKNVEFDQNLSFPFEMPSGYKEMTF